MSQTLPSSVAGFTPIPIAYSSSSTHIIYARAHSIPKTAKSQAKGKAVALPEGRTLFLVNVPPDATEREITRFFKGCGTVERVIFNGDNDGADEHVEEDVDDTEDEDMDADAENVEEDEEQPRKKRKVQKDAKSVVPQVVPLPSPTERILRRTGQSAHVVFLDDSSLSRALTPPTKPRPWHSDSSTPLGLAHYASVYSSLRPPLDVVKAHADSWMELFEYEQAKKKHESKYKKGEAIVDDDGFTLVTRGGAYGQAVGGGVAVASKKFQKEGGGQRSRKNKKEPKEKDTFYAFQIHEKKRKELMDLKKKWEEDKAKVEKLKQSRRFKPY